MTEEKDRKGAEQSAIEQLDGLLPVEDYEEEVSVDGKKEVHKGIYLLPNLVTSGALFAGFYAIVAAMNNDFVSAAIAIVVAGILDGLDGAVARMTHTQSRFGAEYDSLSDCVAFGVAPALVSYAWALTNLGKLGWALAFVYVACAALRLARFNVQAASSADKRFVGMPSPAAAGIVATMVWFFARDGVDGGQWVWLAAVVTTGAGLLMVSNVAYQSFKALDFKSRVPFIVLIMMIVIIAIIVINPPTVLFTIGIIYAVTGPFLHWFSKRKAAGQR